jgi:hypothetical protein
MNTAVALTGCQELCPPPEVAPEVVKQADARFLASLGIRF